MWETALVVLTATMTLGALKRAWGFWVRRNGISRVPPEQITRISRGVPVRALLYGLPRLRGLNPHRSNRTRADLVLTADRFVLASDRGVLADVGAARGRPFTSVRCTGPQRLVIEGDLPGPDGTRGLYRFELVVDDPIGWARALAPFVVPPVDGPRYATEPPRA